MSQIEPIISSCEAEIVMSRHQRKSSLRLYRVLSDCAKICEICLMNQEEETILNVMIKELPRKDGRNRVYVEEQSDIYQKVCRYIFHGDEHSANVNRYAITIRELAGRQVDSSRIVEELTKNGGINAVYLKRPLEAQYISTACLRLTNAIRHKKDEELSLRLVRNSDNTYTVITLSSGGNMSEWQPIESDCCQTIRRDDFGWPRCTQCGRIVSSAGSLTEDHEAEISSLRAESEKWQSELMKEASRVNRDARLRAENARLMALLQDCADDLEAELRARYPEEIRRHHSMQRNFDRDMDTVVRARAVLNHTV